MAQGLCHRYGPGRLPFASRRDVGGGIAMAATGLLATVLWYGVIGLLLVTGMGDNTLGFFFGVGLFFVPIAIPSSFVVGTLLWGELYQDENRPLYGAIFGGVTALCSLAIGALGPALFFGVSSVSSGNMALTETVVYSILLIPAGFLLAIVAAGWLILPLGVFGGWYHERAKGTQ